MTDASYFNAVYKEAVELCVYLCKLYNLTEKDVIGHYEGYQKGIASNHGDPRNWFPKHGKSMDTFRADVKKLLSEGEKPAEQERKKYYRVQIGAYSVKANAEAQLAKAKKAGFTDAFIKDFLLKSTNLLVLSMAILQKWRRLTVCLSLPLSPKCSMPMRMRCSKIT